MADAAARLDFVILDELGYLPFAMSGGQLLFHLISKPASARRSWRRRTSRSGSG